MSGRSLTTSVYESPCSTEKRGLEEDGIVVESLAVPSEVLKNAGCDKNVEKRCKVKKTPNGKKSPSQIRSTFGTTNQYHGVKGKKNLRLKKCSVKSVALAVQQ